MARRRGSTRSSRTASAARRGGVPRAARGRRSRARRGRSAGRAPRRGPAPARRKGRPDDRPRLRQRPRDVELPAERLRSDLRQAEVEELDAPLGRHHDVAGLQVAVQHPLPVRVADGFEHLSHRPSGLGQRQSSLGLQREERRALHVLHRDERDSRRLADLVDRGDARGGSARKPSSLRGGAAFALRPRPRSPPRAP